MRIEAYSQIQNLYNISKPSEKKNTSAVPGFKDKLNISGAGKDLQVAKRAVAAAPDVREDKIAALKEAYENGSYHVSGSDFADRILEKYSQSAI